MLALAAEELPDAPLYYNLHDVAKSVKLSAPPADTFRSALVNAGALTLPYTYCCLCTACWDAGARRHCKGCRRKPALQ
jgi:hypothetical protein